MKRSLFIIISSFLILFSHVSISISADYSIVQVTNYGNESTNSSGLMINDNGDIVWEYWDGGGYILFLYDGSAIKKLDDKNYCYQLNENGYVVWTLKGMSDSLKLYDGKDTTVIAQGDIFDRAFINNNNYVVWAGYDGTDYEIFLYNGSTTTQLTNNDYDDKFPTINDNGYVVWEGIDSSDYNMLFLFDGSTVKQLSDHTYKFHISNDYAMNNNDDVVWIEDDGTDYEIFLYDGSTTTQLTNNDYNDLRPTINDNGYVVWQRNDGSNYQLFLFDGSTVKQLSDNLYERYLGGYCINNNGDVAWSEHDGTDYEIFLYDGSTTTQITNNDYDDENPTINDNGYVVWAMNIGDYYLGDELNPDYEHYVFLFDGSTVIQITGNYYDYSFPIVNDNNVIAWIGYNENIFFATPSGSDPNRYTRSNGGGGGGGCFITNLF